MRDALVDFPVTRELIEQLGEWLHDLASVHPDPVQVPAARGVGFRWEYPEQTVEVVQTAKAVRMVSGVRGALVLADLGHTVECGTLLRAVSDFASEIIFLAEGQLGEVVRAHETFVEQFFEPMPESPEELEAAEKQRYVARRQILAAHKRLADKTVGQGDDLNRISKYLSKGGDAYVHGAYGTAMELYEGYSKRFMVAGNESERARRVMKVAVAGKLHEVIGALELMALTRSMGELQRRIREGRHRLEEAYEQGAPC